MKRVNSTHLLKAIRVKTTGWSFLCWPELTDLWCLLCSSWTS